MPIVRWGWDPLREIARIDDELRRWWLPKEEEEAAAAWMPKTDIKETEKEFLVKTDLPGMKLEDIEVSVDKDRLIIKGERRMEKEEKEKDYTKIERSYGSFYRSFRLSVPVKEEEIKASYKNGVLEVTVPKAEARVAKKIKVEEK